MRIGKTWLWVAIVGAAVSAFAACSGADGESGEGGPEASSGGAKAAGGGAGGNDSQTGGGSGGGGGGGGAAPFEGCPNPAHPPAQGSNCVASCIDCACTSIRYVCDKECYGTASCQVTATPGGTVVTKPANNCGSISCTPQSDVTT